jgi:L-aspartate oxidase
VASTGLHGANRLASNSLLEAVVLGARVATDIKTLITATNAAPIAELKPIDVPRPGDRSVRRTTIARLRKTMTQHVGVIRDAAGLRTALATLAEIESRAGFDGVLANMALAGRMIAAAALAREESRGGHARSDFPGADPALARRTFMTLQDLESPDVIPQSPPVKRIALGRQGR